MWDLVVALDDADGRILHARLVKQEGVASTLEALEAVLRRYGRFCELYTDPSSHFCRTAKARWLHGSLGGVASDCGVPGPASPAVSPLSGEYPTRVDRLPTPYYARC